MLDRHDNPDVAPPAGWLALVRAADGLSVVRAARDDDPDERWAALFSGRPPTLPVTGMLAALLAPLAAAGVPVMVASTHAADAQAL